MDVSDTERKPEESESGSPKRLGAFQREKMAEEIIEQKELSLMDRDPTTASSSSDYDRLLFGSPNSSELWLRYMAHFLKAGKVEKARSVADRALSTIHHK